MIAKVLINTTAKSLNKVYDYNVPERLVAQVELGKRVEVSFGASKSAEGIIVKLEDKNKKDIAFNLKDIISILDEVSYIDEKRLKLAKYISYIYFCNVYDALKLMLPPGTSSKTAKKSLDTKKEIKVRLIVSKEKIEEEIANDVIKSAKHIRVLRFLIENGSAFLKDIVNGLGVSRAIVQTLEKNGYVIREKVEKEVDFLEDFNVQPTFPKTPTKEQKNAIDIINAYTKRNEYKQFLLFGVTGSRKNRSLFASIRKRFKTRKKSNSTCSRDFTYVSNCK